AQPKPTNEIDGMGQLASLFAQTDAIVLVSVTAVVALIALTRKGRPITKSRTMDVVLSALLFVFLGVRYAILAVVVVLFPSAAVGQSGTDVASILAGLYAATAFVGFLTYRGGVGARVAGATVLGVATLCELVASAVVLDVTVAGALDTVLSIAVAAGAGVLAAFFWTYRTATPNPLGADKRPFDY
ncbi:MAG: hypothetical protein AAFW98_00740, partial [Pseudomonadota bacterium]